LVGLASQGDESSAENRNGFINAEAIISSFVYLTNSCVVALPDKCFFTDFTCPVTALLRSCA
jgi:hypothetical protein